MYFFYLKASPDQKGQGDGFYYLTCFPKLASIIDLPSHPNDYKDQFFMSNGFKNYDHRYFNNPRKSSIFMNSAHELSYRFHNFFCFSFLTEFILCAAILARTERSMNLGGLHETLSSLPPKDKDYRQVVNDATMVACNLISKVQTLALRT